MWYVCAPFEYLLCICALYMSLLSICVVYVLSAVSLYYTVMYVSWVLGMWYVYCLRSTVGTLYVVSFVCCVLYTLCVSYSVYVGGCVCSVCISYVLCMLCICVVCDVLCFCIGCMY